MENVRDEEILKSLEGIQGAKAPKGGFAKIQEKLAHQRQATTLENQPPKLWMSIAATITLIACINIWAVLSHQSANQEETELLEEYQAITTDFNFYSNE